jgi:L-ascorbate metabolism protein UlaG (beta-lactamase superfamily)
MVRLKWHGHACFEIVAGGKSLLIDPHDGGSLGVGFTPPRARPDYVLVTHEHYDHNAVESVASPETVVVRERVGVFELGPFRVTGLRLPHDEFGGRLRGFVVAYRVEAEGVAITHLSDLGRPLEPGEAEKLRADVVLAPVGGVYTLHPRRALEAAEALGARVVVPMHFWLPGMQLPLEPLDEVLRYAKRWRVVRHDSSEVEITRDELPEDRVLLVLRDPWGKLGGH